MKQLFLTSLVTSCAIALTACSGSSGGGGSNSAPAADPNVIQQNVNADPVVKANPLSLAQKQLLATLFQDQSLSTDLFLYDKNNETAQSQQTRLQKLAALSPAAKATYDDIEANCQINFVSPATDTSGQTLIPGHSFTQTTRGTTIGLNCPEKVSNSIVSTTTTISSNYQDLQSGATQTLNLVEVFHSKVTEDEMNLPRAYDANSGTSIGHSEVTTDMKFKINGQSTENYSDSTALMNGENTKLGQFSLVMKIRTYATNLGTVNEYVNMDLSFSGVQVILQIYVNPQGQTIYLNGEQMTQEQFHQYFPTFNLN